MRIKFLATGVIAASLLLGSCSTPKNITYFQDVTQGSVFTPTNPIDIIVKPEDKLSIVVTTQDPALSQLFNLNSSNGGGSAGGSNMQYYTVDRAGYINFPVLGELHIAGLNRFQVASYIEEQLKVNDLVKDPIVTIEFRNTGITVLGEVASPGRYEFNKDQMTILDAIALAGDLALDGERDNVLVMRKDNNGERQGYRINLLDMETLVKSPVYFIQQDDVIYVEPNNKLKRNTTPNGNSPFTPAFWISLGSSAITIATLIITLSNK